MNTENNNQPYAQQKVPAVENSAPIQPDVPAANNVFFNQPEVTSKNQPVKYGEGIPDNNSAQSGNGGPDYAFNGEWQPGYYDFPTLECKAARVGFFNCVFPAIFAVAFGSVGAITPLVISMKGEKEFLFIGIPFAVIGLVSAIIALIPLTRYFKVKSRGKEIHGLVCGYMDDNVSINGVPAQIVVLLLDTPVGKRYINYKLGTVQRPYAINSWVDLLVSGDYFLIVEHKEKIDW